jgi:predicted AAA+ superfamily ATPase
LARDLVSNERSYRTLDDPALKQLAENDPAGFVRHADQCLIIDEIQHVPALMPAIKMIVDEDTRPGQYLLTGSAKISSLPGVSESLAGRIRKIRLRPLTQGEVRNCQATFLEQAFAHKFDGFVEGDVPGREGLLAMAFKGGFPEALKLEQRERRHWHRDYIDALLDRDLQDITRIQRQEVMRELIHIVAAWSGKFMDVSSIGSSLSIRRPTLESYLNALEALYITERLKAWTKTDYDRVGKQDKLFMSDSGLMASILGWNQEQVSLDPDRSGKLIETFIYQEIAAQVDTGDGEYKLFHYRDREKREIDFIIEREDQSILGIEVKAGSAIGRNDFRHLKWFRDNIAGDRPFTGIVLYAGAHAGSMGKNLWAIPYATLLCAH